MYRIRSLDNLLGDFKELENQEIYFSDLESLNDPMEGYRVFYWKGDMILWENLIKHYTYSIYCKVIDLHILGYVDDETFEQDNSYLRKEDFLNVNSDISIPRFLIYETDIMKDSLEEIYKEVFECPYIKLYLNYLKFEGANKKIYEEELNSFLFIITKDIYAIIMNYILKDQSFNEERDKGFYKYNNSLYKAVKDKKKFGDFNLNRLKEMKEDEINKIKDVVIKYGEKIKNEIKIRAYINHGGLNVILTLLMDFSEYYLESVKHLAYSKVYVASFMKDIRNASVWANYGNSHTGVCLKYKVNEEDPKILLKRRDYFNEETLKEDLKGEYSLEEYHRKLEPIIYTNELKDKNLEIDFFYNLGTLIPREMNSWFTNDKGEFSTRHYLADDEWRNKYWKDYKIPYFRKGTDWKQEKEYRLKISNMFYNFREKKQRIFKYDFKDLEKIIFGNKTPIEDRSKIVEIVRRKCKEKDIKEFVFYEMKYDKNKNKLKVEEFYNLKLE